jgi:methionyl-tRNA formyltransferase
LRIAFFGTPELARTVLAGVLEAAADDVVLVVCQPDRPRGRGLETEPPPVKALANERGLPVIQPEKLRDGALATRLKDERVDLALVAAYGRILPQDLLDAPRFGAWNVHASILPRHRGASPIQHAILAGDAETGVTLMQMTLGLDEGPMLLVRRTPIAPEETAASLSVRLAEIGARAAVEGVGRAKADGLPVEAQDDRGATFAPRLTKEQGRLDLARPAAELDRQVRALNPWPGTVLAGVEPPLKIVRVRPHPDERAAAEPGTVLEAGPRLLLQTGAGAIEVLELQPPGKRPMAAGDYLRGAGRALTVGRRL